MAVNKEDVKKIIEAIGGKDNVSAATHCVTRLRLALKDDSKVDKETLDQIDLVKGSFKNNNQFQIVIGQGTVDEAYKIFSNEVGIEHGSKEDVKQAATEKMNPLQRFIKMLGDVFIPLLPAIVTAGLLLGLSNLLLESGAIFKNQAVVDAYPQFKGIAEIIKLIAVTPFHFLPALIGWSAMRVFGGSPILGLVLGLILVNPALASQYGLADAQTGEMNEIPTWDVFGLEVQQLNYAAQVLPILIATYCLSVVERFLNKYVHDSIKMLVVGPVALLLVGFLSFVVIGPVAFWLGEQITNFIQMIFENAGWLGGLIYGLVYAPLVITGLHHMFLAVDFQLMSSNLGGTYLWPILAISNIAQGAAAFGAWFMYKRKKMVKEEGLALTSGISGMLGVTEPAMFGVNIPLKYPFISAVITTGLVGILFGSQQVLGKVGVGGVPGIMSINSGFRITFLIGMIIAIILPFVLTVIFSLFAEKKGDKVVKPIDKA
ncbi:PTS system trehalose-specific EIIBC component [Abyssicoccus albus]|uniref:PTS system trehalose-specific IIB component (Glc family) /PTS system trehalose-specific IIC component (Glc family) n=1 Tax=Abyssicoccus albus TaxID=1817405 RepID=A0A3N5CCW7_9BACL|nr:PTS system trehalose-specific EIIBC component [Abyssicoccus albus]RPF56785.1 PTS system trehalose-specific IIB component (Glc family) /PTS system trehalose-specific IIC component (Glc family) [Abyssicoccus albus]